MVRKNDQRIKFIRDAKSRCIMMLLILSDYVKKGKKIQINKASRVSVVRP